MTGGTANRAWDYPDCQRCGTPVFVVAIGGTGRRFKCYGCGALFDADGGGR